MSDSDDTDILLLIPPNYYLTNAEEEFLYEDLKVLQRRQFSSLQELESLELLCKQKKHKRDLTSCFEAMDLAACKNADALSMPPPVAQFSTEFYNYLPPTRKAELNHINARLHNMEKEDIVYGEIPSDISSISISTVRSQFGPSKANREHVGMIHSTPKYMSSSFKEQPPLKKVNYCDKEASTDPSCISTNALKTQFKPGKENREYVEMDHSTSKHKDFSFIEQSPAKETNNFDKEIISEIDNFLSDGMANSKNNMPERHIGNYQLEQQLQQNACSFLNENCQTQANSLPTSKQTLPIEKPEISKSCYQMSKGDCNLISLSEIWGNSGNATAIPLSSQSSLKEEHLRRQHLEKTVRQLQAQLLEYQQRLSVAIEVDRTKDNALNNAQMENKSLAQELHYISKNLQESEQKRKINEEKLESLQKELAQAVSVASKFQEKTEKLEQEISNCSRNANESCKQYKIKIEELEIKAHTCKRSEELAVNELQKLRDKYAKSEHLYEKSKLRCEELEKENSNLKQQKDMLQEYHQKQKNRAENLDAQRRSLQQSLATSTENENTLKRKLELQQKTLKAHYQQQLENVVAQKLKEFQEQLDKTEETLKSEARERERLIAERAVKQLELINEKNELELNLLQEKHNEEVELYRIQLANASKKIDDMEMKLNVYKSKRADIAEKLHNVMETQWQKALEILTSPHNRTQTTHTETDHESPSPHKNEGDNKSKYHTNMTTKANEFQTPKSSKKENNLNAVQATSPMDKLQAYIELLLSKSPTDFDKLDEILSLTSKAKASKERMDKLAKRHCQSKPPWKA